MDVPLCLHNVLLLKAVNSPAVLLIDYSTLCCTMIDVSD